MPSTHCRRRASLLFALLVLPWSAIHAQQQRGPRFGASAGLTIPLSDLSRDTQSGYRLDGFVIGAPYAWPVALRGDLSYSSFSGAARRPAQNFVGLSASAVYSVSAAGDSPYAIGGLGVYHESAYGGVRSESDLGINFGGGYRWTLHGRSYFVEMRYVFIGHSGPSRQMMPLMFGVTF